MENTMAKHRRKKYRGLHFLCGLILFLTLISIVGFCLLNYRNIDITFTPQTFTASNEPLDNPYCGWYRTYSYTIAEDVTFDASTVSRALTTDNTTRLCLLKIDLGAYGNDSLSDHALSEITAILASWSSTDKQILLRFCYENTPVLPSTEPPNLTNVYLHMEQLSPIINQYAGHIYALEGLFVDESLSDTVASRLTSDELADLSAYYASLTDDEIYLGIHDSTQYLTVTGQTEIPSAKNAYDGSLAYRLGIFNDGITGQLSEAGLRATAALSQFVPHGGTMGDDATLTDLTTAIDTLRNQQVSYLESTDNNAIIEAWKNTTYDDDPVFAGLTGYDYMTTHLGYRYVVSSADFSFDTWHDSHAELTVTIDNVGFSSAYRRFETSIILRNTETEEMITLPIDMDNRTWAPSEAATIRQAIDVRAYDKGSYDIFLMITNPASGEVICLGNTMPLSPNGYQLGTLVID